MIKKQIKKYKLLKRQFMLNKIRYYERIQKDLHKSFWNSPFLVDIVINDISIEVAVEKHLEPIDLDGLEPPNWDEIEKVRIERRNNLIT